MHIMIFIMQHNQWTELLDAFIWGLVRLMKVMNSMEHIFLDNKSMPFLRYTVKEKVYIRPNIL